MAGALKQPHLQMLADVACFAEHGFVLCLGGSAAGAGIIARQQNCTASTICESGEGSSQSSLLKQLKHTQCRRALPRHYEFVGADEDVGGRH